MAPRGKYVSPIRIRGRKRFAQMPREFLQAFERPDEDGRYRGVVFLREPGIASLYPGGLFGKAKDLDVMTLGDAVGILKKNPDTRLETKAFEHDAGDLAEKATIVEIDKDGWFELPDVFWGGRCVMFVGMGSYVTAAKPRAWERLLDDGTDYATYFSLDTEESRVEIEGSAPMRIPSRQAGHQK